MALTSFGVARLVTDYRGVRKQANCELRACPYQGPNDGVLQLVVAKCWDPNPKDYFSVPRTEPVRPIDPGAWVAHTAAVRGEKEGRTVCLIFEIAIQWCPYCALFTSRPAEPSQVSSIRAHFLARDALTTAP